MFPYIGGKAHHVKWMDPFFPTDSKTFVEVFGGAGWVTLKSQSIRGASTTVYNDFNPLLANVYECLRTNPKKLLEMMKRVPVSDIDLYKKYQQELFAQLDWDDVELGDFELALKYLYLQTQVFAGTPLSKNNVAYFCDVKSNGKYPSKFNTLKNKLEKKEIQQRVTEISIVENLDCVELIKKYDSADTFFYLDPPYYKMEFYYSKDFPREKHKELAHTLSNIKGRFALSYYDFDDLNEFYPKNKFNWHRQSVYRSAATRSSVTNSKTEYSSKSRGTEILIMNYDLEVNVANTIVNNRSMSQKSQDPLNSFFDLG